MNIVLTDYFNIENLNMSYYGFTFVQPRQNELIEILEDADDNVLIDELLINLSPI